MASLHFKEKFLCRKTLSPCHQAADSLTSPALFPPLPSSLFSLLPYPALSSPLYSSLPSPTPLLGSQAMMGEVSAFPHNQAGLNLTISFTPDPKHIQVLLPWPPCLPPAATQLSPALHPRPLGRCQDLLSHFLTIPSVLNHHRLPPPFTQLHSTRSSICEGPALEPGTGLGPLFS